jgi:hypothetical protein
VSHSSPRPQDRLRLLDGAARPGERVIEPHSAIRWTLASLPLIGYFIWYHRAHRDCSRLLEDSSDPWFWLVMLFPGMLLVIPYAIAQAKMVARVEIATRRPLPTAGYLALCAFGFFIPALLPLALQPRLNQAAATDYATLRRLAVG